jgi:Ca2+-binding EF-hand superfamily protein
MKMKLALFLFLLPATASAFSCGGTLTESCLGEKDIRYDKEASNALTDQAPVYIIFQGYYNCTEKFYDATTGLPLVDGTSVGSPDLKVFPKYSFMNNTFIGSRFYGHRINVFENVNQGGPGFAAPQETFATSTYEKDGSQIQVGTNADFKDIFKSERRSNTYAVDDRTIYYSASTELAGNLLSVSELYVCLDDECRQLSSNQDSFVDLGATFFHLTQGVRNCDKIDSADEWIQAVQEAYVAYNVPEDRRNVLPTEGGCLTRACPTEEDWCKTDPECSESPYQEPDASVKGGAIAGFTVAGIVLLIAGLYALHVMKSRQQKQRYKTKFAKRIAANIDRTKSMRQLTPEALGREFKKIDSENPGGNITKEGLWKFLSTGKAGDISQSDFNSLFAAIDLDNNGTVDFLEFCTFMGQCSDEYRFERGNLNRGSVAERASRRFTVDDMADTAPRPLSTPAPGRDDSAKLPAFEDATQPAALEAGEDEQEKEEQW